MITPEKLQTPGKSLDSGEASIYVLDFIKYGGCRKKLTLLDAFISIEVLGKWRAWVSHVFLFVLVGRERVVIT